LTSPAGANHFQGMNTQQRIDRLEDALSSLGTIIEAEGRWAKSENPTIRVFGEKFNDFVAAVAKERYDKP
jgi:hypothetical protein